MTIFDWQNELNRDGHRVVISGQPIAMHCHHYNINLQRTLEETLGAEGVALLYRSAEETNYNSLRHLFNQYKKIKTLDCNKYSNISHSRNYLNPISDSESYE